MKTKVKKVKGQLLDLVNNKPVVDGLVEITLKIPDDPAGYPEYEAYLTISDFKPEISSHTYNLVLGDAISGEVFVYIVRGDIPSRTRTKYKVDLQGSEWGNLEWFDSL